MFTNYPSRRSPRAPRTISKIPLGVELLEERCLLAADFGLLGPEFQINSYTTDSQFRVAAAMDGVGNFVAVWESIGQDGSGLGIQGQLYSSSGAPVGPEFRVNSYTTGNQRSATVAMDAAGNFVVAWSSDGQDGSGNGIFAQRYNSNGATLGSEFQVNSYTTGSQESPSVAVDEHGNFVIAWSSFGQDGSGSGIFAQRYTSMGVPLGGEFQVNTFTAGAQQAAKVAIDDGGNFVITWESDGQDGSNLGIFAQRYSSAGLPQGSEFQVNTYTTSQQRSPSIAMNGSGDFVIAWTSLNQDGSNYGIYAQRYNASGVPQGDEFRVNTYTTGFQYSPTVAMDAAGQFVVAWLSAGQDGSGYGIFAQRYSSTGVSQGGEFRVNTYTTGSQMNPSVAMNSTGSFLVAWDSVGQDGSGAGVFAQRFGPSFLPTPAGDEFQVNTYTTGNQGVSGVALDSAGNYVVVWNSQYQDGTASSIFAQRYNATGVPQGGEFQVNSYTTSTQYVGGVVMDAVGNFVVVWWGQGPAVPFNTNVYFQRFDALGVPLGGETLVNTATTNSQEFSRIAMDAAGNFVVTWSSSASDPTSRNVSAQRFNAAGIPLGGEIQINTYTTGMQWNSQVAMDALGNFVVIWQSDGQDGSGAGIFGRRFSAAGVPLGGEFQVNTSTTNDQLNARVAMDRSGNFVVIWTSEHGSSLNAYGRLFHANGAPMGDEFLVNNYTTGSQRAQWVTMDESGNFLITWGGRGNSDTTGIYGAWYDSSGSTLVPEFLINTYTTDIQLVSRFGTNHDGQIVIAWNSAGQDGSPNSIFAQRYERPVGIRDVQVRGTAWDAGHPWYPIPVGNSNQLRSLPWTNVDQIRIVFSGPVEISSGDLEWVGVNVLDYSALVSSFDYDASTFTATWTLSTPIGADKLRIRFANGAVTDASGRPIDGEWTDGSSTYVSGSGTPGGTFAFRFNVLPGDTNGNGSVTTADVVLVRNRLFSIAGLPGFDLMADLNGNLSVTTADVSQARNQLFTSLPGGDPASATAMVSIFLSIEDEILEPEAASATMSDLSVAAKLGGDGLTVRGVDAYFSESGHAVVESEHGSATPFGNRDRNRMGSGPVSTPLKGLGIRP